MRRNYDIIIENDQTFTQWALDVLESAVYRAERINEMFPGMKFVGKTTNGVIIQDKQEIIQKVCIIKENLKKLREIF